MGGAWGGGEVEEAEEDEGVCVFEGGAGSSSAEEGKRKAEVIREGETEEASDAETALEGAQLQLTAIGRAHRSRARACDRWRAGERVGERVGDVAGLGFIEAEECCLDFCIDLLCLVRVARREVEGDDALGEGEAGEGAGLMGGEVGALSGAVGLVGGEGGLNEHQVGAVRQGADAGGILGMKGDVGHISELGARGDQDALSAQGGEGHGGVIGDRDEGVVGVVAEQGALELLKPGADGEAEAGEVILLDGDVGRLFEAEAEAGDVVVEGDGAHADAVVTH